MNEKEKIKVLFLSIVVTITFLVYFFVKKSIPANQLENGTEFLLIRTISILVLNFGFLILIFLIDLHQYKKLLIIIIVTGLSAYVLSIIGRFVPLFSFNGDLFEIIVFLSYAIIPPGIIANIIYYIKNFSNEYVDKTYGNSWHIHESFLGVILLAGGALLIISNFLLSSHPIFHQHLSFIISIIGVFLYFLLFFGGFLIFRDWEDFVEFKFIEKKESSHPDKKGRKSVNSEVFNEVTHQDISFFEPPHHKIFPIGLLLTTISLSILIYNKNLIPINLVPFSETTIKNFAFFLSFLSGGILGKDWLRLFAKFYPETKLNLEGIIKKLKKIEYRRD